MVLHLIRPTYFVCPSLFYMGLTSSQRRKTIEKFVILHQYTNKRRYDLFRLKICLLLLYLNCKSFSSQYRPQTLNNIFWNVM